MLTFPGPYSCAKLLQSCLTLCDHMDCSLPGSPVHRILQATILEWVTVPSSRASSQPRVQPAFPVAPALQVDSYCWDTSEAPHTAKSCFISHSSCTNAFFSFWLFHAACRVLVSQPGIVPLAVKAWSPNHWTAREVPLWYLKSYSLM